MVEEHESNRIWDEFEADADIDIFHSTLDQLVYHNDLHLLLSAMQKGWEKVKNSSEIVP